jgi:succinate dehydrogenase / fumarate reductase iron-sulfur subunit
VGPWIIPFPPTHVREHKMFPHDIEKLGHSHQCILCGICNANVKSENWNELGPAAFVKGFRYYADSRDSKPMERLKTLQSFLLVHYSLSKADLCPRDIAPGEKIAFLGKQKPLKEEKK